MPNHLDHRRVQDEGQDPVTKAKASRGGQYAHRVQEGFPGAWDPTGLKPDAEKALADRGLIAKQPKAASRRRPSSGTAAKPAASTAPRDLEAELPSRAKRKRPLKSRHFRLPKEIDEKLEFLADQLETTMVYVVCKALQEEWLRVQRQARRDERIAVGEQASSGESDPDD